MIHEYALTIFTMKELKRNIIIIEEVILKQQSSSNELHLTPNEIKDVIILLHK